MLKIISRHISLLFLLFAFGISAQNTTEEPTLNESTVEGQFDYIYKKGGNWQDYKMIKKVLLDQIRKNILDSVATVEAKLIASNKLTDTQNGEITTLKASLNDTNNKLTTVNAEKDSITFLGSQMEKPTYKTIMWSVISLLTLIILFLGYKYKNANTITQEAKNTLIEIEDEYEDYRRKALEREQKVRRQLQDEINKQKLTKAK